MPAGELQQTMQLSAAKRYMKKKVPALFPKNQRDFSCVL